MEKYFREKSRNGSNMALALSMSLRPHRAERNSVRDLVHGFASLYTMRML